MLKFSHLSLRRGNRELLHDVDLTIHAGQRVGITGANGVGKSSLFALIRAQLQPDAGELVFPSAIVIAHVAQETPALDMSALEYVLDGDQELRSLEKNIQQAEAQGDGEALAHYYTELENIDGYAARSRAASLIHGLGFTSAQEQTPVKAFSGGWRMRLNLAQALMCRSDLLLLDEPTNHLDLDAVLWLENWLRQYRGTLLLISHDRDFLDNVTDHIAHIEHGSMKLYSGNYSAFEVLRSEQLACQQAAYEKQQREIAHIQHYVTRFRAKATKARQAQSRLKTLQRMELISAAHVDSPFSFSFAQPDKLPDPILTLDNVAVGYAATPLLSRINFSVRAGDRLGLLGHNGAGKSTLIKLLAGELQPLSGEVIFAREVKIGYFAQHQLEQLDLQASPLLHLQRLDKRATEKELRNFLGGFAFHGDMATEPVAPLSGGEKARLVLALLVYQRPNLLLLDEPTNHLDLEMRHALTLAMQDYVGAMVIVSHDRHLLRSSCDEMLLVDHGEVAPFAGDLDDYRDWLNQQANTSASGDATGTAEVSSDAAALNKKQLRQQAADKRKQLQPLKNRLQKLEKQLEQLNQEKQQLQVQLAEENIYATENRDQLRTLLERQGILDKQLEQIENEWYQASEDMENSA